MNKHKHKRGDTVWFRGKVYPVSYGYFVKFAGHARRHRQIFFTSKEIYKATKSKNRGW